MHSNGVDETAVGTPSRILVVEGATFGYRDITAVAGKLERLVDRALAGKELDVAAIGTGLERLSKVTLKIELSGGRKPRSRTADPDAVSGSRE